MNILSKFFILFVYLLLTACSGGSDNDSDSNNDSPSNNNSDSSSAVSSVMTLFIAEASATEIPEGSTALVSISGQGVNKFEYLDNESLVAQFDDLIIGTYNIQVLVSNDGEEIGSYSNDINLTLDGASIEATINFNRASLVVEPIVASDYSNLNGIYDGQWFVKTGLNSCIQTPFNVSSADVTLTLTENNISLFIDAFFDPTFNLTGTIDDTSTNLTGAGTYQSSDFSSGTWELDKISMPSENAIFFNIDLNKTTNGNCLITLEYLGFK